MSLRAVHRGCGFLYLFTQKEPVPLRDGQKQKVLTKLRSCEYSRANAARPLGIDRSADWGPATAFAAEAFGPSVDHLLILQLATLVRSQLPNPHDKLAFSRRKQVRKSRSTLWIFFLHGQQIPKVIFSETWKFSSSIQSCCSSVTRAEND